MAAYAMEELGGQDVWTYSLSELLVDVKGKKVDITHLLSVRERLIGKQVIGYGAGHTAQATIRAAQLELSYIVDDSLELQGQKILGIPIKSPACLKDVDKDNSFVIVFVNTSKSALVVQECLNSLGFTYIKNWIDCSILHYHTIGKRLRAIFGIQPDVSLFAKTRLLHFYSSVENLSSISGTWLFQELLKNIDGVIPGSIAELGVYKGGNAFISLMLLGKEIQNRPYHLFDSFEGFSEISSHDPLSRTSEFADTSLSSIKTLFSNFGNVRLHVGFFSDTLCNVSEETFALVYVDCDLYESTLECCEFFYQRLRPGGILLFHDYDSSFEPDLPSGIKAPFTGVKKAVDEFFSERPENLLVFPETTHALVIKR